MRKWTCYVGTILSMGALLACGGAEGEIEQSKSRLPEEIPDAEAEVLHEISVEGERLSFIGGRLPDGTASVMMQSETSAFQGSVLDALRAEHGELTALEVFYALTDGSVVPHELLAETHADQAEHLAREDASTQRVEFSPPAVEKLTATACDGWIFDNSYVDQDYHSTFSSGVWDYYEPHSGTPVSSTTSRRDYCMENNCSERWHATQVVGTCSEGPVESRVVANDGSGWFVWSDFETFTGAVRWVRWVPGSKEQNLSVQSTNEDGSKSYSQRGDRLQFQCHATGTCFPPHHPDMILGN